jgi:hypothetical protein
VGVLACRESAQWFVSIESQQQVPRTCCCCCCQALLKWLGFLSYTPEQLGTLTHVIEDMEHIREQQLAGLAPDEVLGEPEPDAVKVC